MTSDYSLLLTGQSLIRRDPAGEGAAGYPALVELIRGADAAFTNFEGTIRGRHGGWPTKNKSVHASPPDILACLRAMGFSLLSLANNHASDLGPGGILSTIEAARAEGFVAGGTGSDQAAAERPAIGMIGGRRVALVAMDAGPWPDQHYAGAERPGVSRLAMRRRIGLPVEDYARLSEILAETGQARRAERRAAVGFQAAAAPGTLDFYGLALEPAERAVERMEPDPADLARKLEAVAEARASADLVVAYLHNHYWASEWEQVPDWVRGLARQLVDAGADLFVGHGVPALQGMEIYRGRPLFFGLGNFIFHSARDPERAMRNLWDSLVATCRYGDGGALAIELRPIRLDRAPELVTGEALLDAFLARSDLAGARVERWDGMAVVIPIP